MLGIYSWKNAVVTRLICDIETSLLSRCFSGLLCSVRRGLMCIGLGVGPIVAVPGSGFSEELALGV